MQEFTYVRQAARVVFGAGTLERLREEVERLGCSRAMVLTTAHQADLAARARELLGPLIAGEFAGAAMHTPTDVTESALNLVRELGADCVVAIGGGSTTGLSKALAVRTGLPQIVIPTTYAGSEVTPVLGETDDGVKTTRSSPEILPETVLYDVDLTLGLPVPLSVTSGVNAMAHAVEALYAPQANPVTDELALRSIALMSARPSPDRRGSRRSRSTGGRPAGRLAGRHLPGHRRHGPAPQAVPHPRRFVRPAARRDPHGRPAARHGLQREGGAGRMRRIAGVLGAADAPAAVYDLVSALHGPVSLGELGLREEDLAKAAELAVGDAVPQPPGGHRRRRRRPAAATPGTGRRPASGAGRSRPPRCVHSPTRWWRASTRPPTRECGSCSPTWSAGCTASWRTTTSPRTSGSTPSTSSPAPGRCPATPGRSSSCSPTRSASPARSTCSPTPAPPRATPSAVLGPFYVEGPPPLPNGSGHLPGHGRHTAVDLGTDHRHGRHRAAGRGGGRLAVQRGRLLRRPAPRPRRPRPAGPVPLGRRRAGASSGRSCRRRTRSPATGRWARCWTPSAGTPTARRTCTS